MNAQEFNTLASDSSKAFRLESFCFTHDFGLNIYFENLEQLKEIVRGTEIEFWQLEIINEDTYIDVNNWKDLEKVLSLLDEVDGDVEKLEYLNEIVKGGYATWDNARDWHNDNHFCEELDNYDFGHYLTHDVNCIEIPEALQGYINYEQLGKDAKINDFVVIGSRIYYNR